MRERSILALARPSWSGAPTGTRERPAGANHSEGIASPWLTTPISRFKISKRSPPASPRTPSITNAAARHIGDDMRLASRAVDWTVATQQSLGKLCDEVTAQVHGWREHGLRDISREELLDELEGIIADVCGNLGREI
jgi:hypothetical protein